MGRCLPKCGHGFHVECIDMWLSSHSNCPICRAPIVVNVVEIDSSQVVSSRDHGAEYGGSDFEIVVDAGSDETRESDHGNGNGNGGARTSVSLSETSSSFLGCSLERMLGKVFPSAN